MESGASAGKSITRGSSSSRLFDLAQQLRVYKAEESTGKLISPTAKKAAVLICLFEGEDGDFRVILTKRSSGLSTHSGLSTLPIFEFGVIYLTVILILWMMGGFCCRRSFFARW